MMLNPLALLRLRPLTLLAAVLLPAVIGCAGPVADATPAARSGTATDPAAAVPAARHESAFSGYRALGEPSLRSWKAANDEVGRIGGWRAYTREAQQALVAPAAPASAARAASAPQPAAAGAQR